jgi:hypothetical protein
VLLIARSAVIKLTNTDSYDIIKNYARFIKPSHRLCSAAAFHPDRYACSKNSEKQRENSGDFAVLFFTDPSEVQDFRRKRDLAR